MSNFKDNMNSLLVGIDDKYDKRESSLIYQSLAMFVPEIMRINNELEFIEDEAYPDTCSYRNLLRFCESRSIIAKKATYGIVKAEFDAEVENGDRFNCDDRNYSVIEKISEEQREEKTIYLYKLIAEETGSIPIIADLTPIEGNEQLTIAKLVEIIKDGTEDESRESLLKRYLDSIQYQPFGGNRSDYIEKVNSIENVGGCKVFRRQNGQEEIEIMVIDDKYKGLDDEVKKRVQDIIDPTKDGEGIGIAPFGHKVSILAPEVETLNVGVRVQTENETNIERLKEDIKRVLEAYFDDLRHNWATESNITVRVSQIENRVLDIRDVIDVVTVVINGRHRKNATLDGRKIPILRDLIVERARP